MDIRFVVGAFIGLCILTLIVWLVDHIESNCP